MEHQDEELLPDFKEEAMMIQLKKIMDTEKMTKPVSQVKTDCGDVITGVHARHARRIMEKLLAFNSSDKMILTRFLQTTRGFEYICFAATSNGEIDVDHARTTHLRTPRQGRLRPTTWTFDRAG